MDVKDFIITKHDVIKLYPNPVNKVLIILIEKDSQSDLYHLELVNYFGQPCNLISLDKMNSEVSVNGKTFLLEFM